MISRRLLIKSLSVLTLCGLMMGMLASCSQPKTEKFVGIQLWSVRDSMKTNPKGTIEQLGKMGYKFIEAANYGDGKFYGMEPAEFKALVEANGMTFLSSHTGQNLPDSASWDSTMTWWDKCIDAHVAAGVKYIVQPWMDKAGYSSLEGLKRYCDYFNAVGEKCNAKGIRFGYHNHDGEFKEIDSMVIYDFMLQNTDPTKVMFQLDLYWINKGGRNAVEYFNAYPGRFELWHVKDEAELGASGTMDYKPAFENAGKSGMKYFVVEVEHYNFDQLTSVQKSLEFLNAAEYVK